MKNLFFLALCLMTMSAFSQNLNPVKWTFTKEKAKDGSLELVFTAEMEEGWYIYSQTLESEDGPIPTTFSFMENHNVDFSSNIEEKGKKVEGFDPIFQMKVTKYANKVEFRQKIAVRGDVEAIEGFVEFMSCDSEKCLPPREVDFVISLKD